MACAGTKTCPVVVPASNPVTTKASRAPVTLWLGTSRTITKEQIDQLLLLWSMSTQHIITTPKRCTSGWGFHSDASAHPFLRRVTVWPWGHFIEPSSMLAAHPPNKWQVGQLMIYGAPPKLLYPTRKEPGPNRTNGRYLQNMISHTSYHVVSVHRGGVPTRAGWICQLIVN